MTLLLILDTDPLLPNYDENSSLSDLQLVFKLYFRAEQKPTYNDYDFDCTLPISYFDIDENTTVALGTLSVAKQVQSTYNDVICFIKFYKFTMPLANIDVRMYVAYVCKYIRMCIYVGMYYVYYILSDYI